MTGDPLLLGRRVLERCQNLGGALPKCGWWRVDGEWISIDPEGD